MPPPVVPGLGYCRGMAQEPSQCAEQVRAAEVIGALCLATDLGMGFPLEHGLQSTLAATRLADRLGVDPATASQAYYACLLSHARCPSRRARRPCVPFRSRADSRGSPGCSVRTSPPSVRWRRCWPTG